MDKNLILAVVLSIGVYAAWFALVERRMPPPSASQSAGRQAPPSALSGAPAPAAALPERPAMREETLRIADAQIKASAYGAAISSYLFDGPVGKVELVTHPEPGLLASWPDLAFDRIPAEGAGTLSFEARHPSGFTIRKEYRFGPAAGLNFLRIALKNPGAKPVEVPPWRLSLGPGIGTVESEQKENVKLQRAVGLYPPPPGRASDRIERFKPGEYKEPWKWLAVDNRYFIAAVAAPSAAAAAAEYQGCSVEFYGADKAPALALLAKGETLAPGASSVHEVPFYVGPKGYARLKALKLNLERSVDFGWFDFLGRRILRVLQFIYRGTGNYGWSIILLTLMLQLLLSPLTYKSMKAAAAMKKLQPEIAKLQQKFKGDPQRLNVEMMQLYKAEGANPLGGCLPMLAQIPIFVALFNALRNCWDLHGSPWILWIRDLSAHDPYYILPLVMGGVMFLQNKLNQAQVADPAQAQVMTFMPVIFTFMFLNFPSGLVLYWLTNSVLSTAQQLALRKRFS